jgi:hypothetical protein
LALGRLEQRLEQELNKAKERAMLLTRAEEKLAALFVFNIQSFTCLNFVFMY